MEGPAKITGGTGVGDYLHCADEKLAETRLADLLCAGAEPVIRRIVPFKLRNRGDPADIEDVCSDAMAAVMASLEQLREDGGREEIADFHAFVAVIAYRACSDWVRRRFPQFHRLRNRARYFVQSSTDLALWQDASGDWLCGWLRWQPHAGRPSIMPAVADPERLAEDLALSPVQNPAAPIRQILERAGGPVAFDTLIHILALHWGVTDSPHAVGLDSLPVADSAPLPDAVMERNQWLLDLWREICILPARQRAALLLNLRDETGNCATTVFVSSGVAGLPELAAALAMPLEEFVELWRHMPLSDLDIASRLNVSRQQVINFRKCAKERLVRRLRKDSTELEKP
jgi:DNA-directed RNA polymerase specialized sigma24 family protein